MPALSTLSLVCRSIDTPPVATHHENQTNLPPQAQRKSVHQGAKLTESRKLDQAASSIRSPCCSTR